MEINGHKWGSGEYSRTYMYKFAELTIDKRLLGRYCWNC